MMYRLFRDVHPNAYDYFIQWFIQLISMAQLQPPCKPEPCWKARKNRRGYPWTLWLNEHSNFPFAWPPSKGTHRPIRERYFLPFVGFHIDLWVPYGGAMPNGKITKRSQ